MRESDDDSSAAVLGGGGELGRRMRALDWATTPLGPVESWPQSLRTCVRIILTSRQPMFVWWGDQLINLYNDAYISILGGKHPAALGQQASEVWREIWDDVGPRAARAIRDDEGTFDEALLLIMERNGYREETYYTFSYSPVPNDSGQPGGILCANSSDTQRIFGERQQALLREVAARTATARTVAEACNLALSACATNPKDLPFALLYLAKGDGVELVSTAGFPQNHALVVDDSTAAWPIRDVLAGAPLGRRDLEGLNFPYGAWPQPPSEAIAIPIAAENSIAGVLVVGRNPFRLLDDDYRRFLELLGIQIGNAIARARTVEEERRRTDALAELDRAKTTFFSNISHEFRTPLTLMLGPTEDALRSEKRALDGEALDALHRNELRLLKLVNALLDFSRIEAGSLQAVYEVTNLARLTSDLASTFRSAVERAGLKLEVDCSDTGAPVSIDTGMWEKIVLNLLSNAFKFTFEGRIAVRCETRDDKNVLVVQDTGIGIPADELPRIFDRFHRVAGAKSRTYEGSGIGLALTSELVKLLGGTIAVDSEPARGTTFTVSIPRREGRPCAELASVARDSIAASAFAAEVARWEGDYHQPTVSARTRPPLADSMRARVVVADDNADMRDYLSRLLSERWEVTAVGDGASALALARETRPDLVLTDVMMPMLDGFGLLRALRDDPQLASVPVILLSARAGEEARIEGIEAGADDYLIKPFSARELMARVSNLLQLAALRRQVELERNRLASFIDQTPVGVVIWEGPQLTCRLTNDAYQRMVRRPIRLGTPLREALPELVGTPSLARVEQVLREGVALDTLENAVSLTGADGETRLQYFNTSYRPLLDEHGATSGVISVSSDITEQVLARQAVEETRAQAVAANRAKDEFLAMLGHELRNPLAPILTALELMRLRGDDALLRERQIIERQTRHLTTLVEDLLDVSRIVRGVVELDKKAVVLGDIVARSIETAAPLFEQRRHQLTTDVPRSIVVDGDPDRLTQVFANLLTNSAKYTDPGGRVSISAAYVAPDVVVTVTDTGRGISEEMLPRVFDLFVQEQQHLDRSRGGLGLGLAIVRNLVELHGGRVTVSSAGLGKGSTFSVSIPGALNATLAATSTSKSEAPALKPPSGLSILIVDDNLDAAEILSELLALNGHVTRTTSDGAETLAIASGFVPDVAILDIGLPGMDGYELARNLRELSSWSRVKLYALTGYGQQTDRALSKAAGFDEHLVKPIDIEALEALLHDRRSPKMIDTVLRPST